MLTYMGTGARDYWLRPVPTYTRGVWEFQAVLAGSIAPVLPRYGPLPLRSGTLWVFPPGSMHGWTGARDKPAEVLVFHFSRVAPELEALCKDRDLVDLGLEPSDAAILADIRHDLEPGYHDPPPLFPLKARIAADRLALMVCTRHGGQPGSPGASDRAAVARVVAIFASEMEYGITLEDLAARSAVSTAHLRRLFHRVSGRPPREVLEDLRMRRARELCCNTASPLGEVARACGFAEQSSFTKAFVRYWGITPTRMRIAPVPPLAISSP